MAIYTIRDVMVEDAAAIAALCTNELGSQVSAQQVEDKLIARSNSSQDKIFVAVADGQIVGFAHATSYETLYYPSLKTFMGLAVAGTYRHSGIGSALLDAIEAWAKEDGACGIRLNSGSARLDAHQFFRNHGYGSEKLQLRLSKSWV